MRRWHLLLLLLGCGVTDPQTLRASAVVQGTFARPPGVTGDGWLFLYRPFEGPPAEPAVPVAVTAVSAGQLERSGRFVFGEVGSNPYRLVGLLDVDQDFRADVDVLAQVTAGDRVGPALEFDLQPGRPLEVAYAAETVVTTEPPAFRVENATSDTFSLDATEGVSLTVVNLVADPLGRFDPAKRGFPVGLVDDDGDGLPDDRDGDRVPDLTLTALLRWLPRPGQHRAGTDVVVPLVLDPSTLLSRLEGNVRLRLLVDRLSFTVVPQAQEVLRRQGRREVRPFGPPPRGDYELVVLAGAGQFWRLPNQLRDAHPSQAVRFRFERGQP